MPQLNVIQTLCASVPHRSIDPAGISRSRRCRSVTENLHPELGERIPASPVENPASVAPLANVRSARAVEELDPLYIFACHVEWERSQEPGAGWELISAAQSPHSDTRAHARGLLASSRHLGGSGLSAAPDFTDSRKRQMAVEDDMKGPYGLEITEHCVECVSLNAGHFCQFSQSVLDSLDQVSHKSTLPAGAILFVEGQAARGIFIVCSGKVRLSTTSREGKILILKAAEPGEALGLSSAVSGMPYETTAETGTPCQLSFVERKHFLELMQMHSEIGMHAAECLSREYRSAYRDIHDLVLTRSSSGKLARLLLSQAVKYGAREVENAAITPMTHEEMAQRIGSSRETVTRLLSALRKKRLISLNGPTLVIRDRSGLEALAV